MLRRKVDKFLKEWKENKDRNPLIIKGARQIGKTTSIREFGKSYKSFIEINFILEPYYKNVFSNGFNVNEIIKQISIYNPSAKFIEGDTLILFDEIQEYPDGTTSLKSFKEDGRFDVICSGSLLGIHYKKISSVAVGFKEDYQMYSMDFEEFLWAKGYNDDQIDHFYSYMKNLSPIPNGIHQQLHNIFEEYIFCGGMPRIIQAFINDNHFSNVFGLQYQLHLDYENDITKYVEGLDYARVQNMYRHISSQLAKDNHKFQITKLGHGARAKDYKGCEEWLKDAGIINIAYNLNLLEFPFKGNEDENHFRIYYADQSLFIANLDEESNQDLRINRNFGIYSGAMYENIVAESLVKQGYNLYFYKNEYGTIELDFVIRVKNEIIPIEVKSNRGKSKSLNAILNDDKNSICYGVKLSANNIGFENNMFTFPYYLSFLLKRFFNECELINW